jgi:hypothetical protein
MISQYVGDYIKEQDAQELDREFKAEREWAERYADESIPEWMDEERITARAYEGEDLVDNYTRTRYAESPEDIDERIKAYQENYGETAEERVEAYQEEWKIGESTYSTREDDNEAEQQAVYRIKAW